MNTAANPAFRPSDHDLQSMNRAVTWSIGLHVAVVIVCIVVPRDWIKERPRPTLTITLGGMTGPKTTGTTSIGGRTVEQVAPPPKRPEPIRPVQTKNEPAPIPVKAPPPTAKPVQASKPEPPPTRPVTTGQQVTKGSTQIDTGARGQGVGLTSGGGGTGGETDLSKFCCPEYLQLLTSQIDASWERAGKRQPEKGETVIRFTIKRDGSVEKLEIVQPSGSGVLDRASRAAIQGLRMTPLPAAYPDSSLTVRVNFPYEGS